MFAFAEIGFVDVVVFDKNKDNLRRGDYVKIESVSNILGAQPLEYYREAAALVASKSEKPEFFIFSDDIEWVKENLHLSFPTTYVSAVPGIKAYEELYLMSLCTHSIISNSTFSWWGAWLNQHKEKIVIAPKKWFNDSTWGGTDIVPDSWIKL